MKDYTHHTVAELSDYFKNFAEREPKENSPFYYPLSLAIAENEYLVKLASFAAHGQPIANIFLASVQYLLFQSPEEKLAEYYPSLGADKTLGVPLNFDDFFAHFVAFCKKNEEAIKTLMTTKLVQTNASNRSAYLMPLFSQIAQENGKRPLTLVDIGTSAGLNLLWDQFAYRYSFGEGLEDRQLGTTDSLVEIKSEVRGKNFPEFEGVATVEQRIGLDQNPLDLRNEENALWLKALIWPDHFLRFRRMKAAIQIAQDTDLELGKAQSIADFDSVVEQIDKRALLCIYHTHVLYQFSPEARQEFQDWLDDLGKKRNFYYLGVEGMTIWKKRNEVQDTPVELTRYWDGEKEQKLVALTTGHAGWVEFM